MAHYKLVARLDRAKGNIHNGFVDHVEDGGVVCGHIEDNAGKELGAHCSTTLAWLEHDLLRKVRYNAKTDTYEKNW